MLGYKLVFPVARYFRMIFFLQEIYFSCRVHHGVQLKTLVVDPELIPQGPGERMLDLLHSIFSAM
jgi:hypothetical protein